MTAHRPPCYLFVCAMIVGLSLSTTSLAEPIDVTSAQIPLHPTDPQATQAGSLSYKGGLVLRSSNPRFGGFSGLGVSSDGTRMVSVSDAGMSLSASLTYNADGELSGLSNVELTALADTDGSAVAGKRWSDAESMSPGVDGEILVSFERDHRIWRYDPATLVPKTIRPPDELADLPSNNGIEALTLLNDGRLLAIAEGKPREPASVAWLSSTSGWDVLTYLTNDGFRATGAATLADGSVLVLERYFTPRDGVRIRVRQIDQDDLQPGAQIEGELITDLRPPLNIDNFEGIETIQTSDGSTHVYLISDDNFNSSQRTLLLMFELK